jgi:hypothetical protein
MTELEKSKPKRGTRQRTFAIDFVSPLQLEECLHHIKNLPETHRLKMTIEHSTEDSASFSAEMFRGTHLLIHYHGKIQRWGSSSTGVSGKAVLIPEAILQFVGVLTALHIGATLLFSYLGTTMFGADRSYAVCTFFSVLIICNLPLLTNVPVFIVLALFLGFIKDLLSEREFKQMLGDILADQRKIKTAES